MARITNTEARELARIHEIPLGQDFHALDSSTVDRILQASIECKYKQPKNANGSKARYFYALLNRVANSESPILRGQHELCQDRIKQLDAQIKANRKK